MTRASRLSFPVIAIIVPAALRARAAAFDPHPPDITRASAHWLLGVGIVLTLALLAFLFIRKRPGRRFSFSLRWLMAFCLACSVIVWGGTRLHLAGVQEREFDEAVQLKLRLAEDVDFFVYAEIDFSLPEPLPPKSVNQILAMLNAQFYTNATVDPSELAAGEKMFGLWRDMQRVPGELAFKLLAKAAGLQCETHGNRIMLVKRSAELLARDAEIDQKLDKIVSIDFQDTKLPGVLAQLRTLTSLELNIALNTDHGEQFTPVTLCLHDVEARNAVAWVLRLCEMNLCRAENGELVEKSPQALERDLRHAAAMKKKLDACQVSFEFADKSLEDAVKFIADAAHVDIVIDPKVIVAVPPAINLRVTKMSAMLALDWVLKLAEVDYSYVDQALYVTKPSWVRANRWPWSVRDKSPE